MQTIGQILLTYYNDENKFVQQNTINSYLSRIKAIYIGLDVEYGDPVLLTDRLDETLAYVMEKFTNTSTQKTTYSALVIFAKALKLPEEIIIKIQKQMNIKIKAYNKEQSARIVEEELPVVKFYEIKKNLEKQIENIDLNKNHLLKSQRTIMTRWLIFNLYTIQPPVRNDYGNFIFKKEDSEEDTETKTNYIDMKKRLFVFNKYKTAKKYGRVVVPFREGIYEIIEKFSPFTGDGTNLFTKPNGGQMSRPYFSQMVSTTFGAGVSNLRKIYLTSKYAKIYDLLREMDEDARCMLHSPDVVKTHYLHKLVNPKQE